ARDQASYPRVAGGALLGGGGLALLLGDALRVAQLAFLLLLLIGLAPALALGFLAAAPVVLGDACGDEGLVGRVDVVGGPHLLPAACDLELAAGEEAALVAVESGACLGEPLAPQQKLAILRQPQAERRLAQQRLMRHLDHVNAAAPVLDQQALVGEALDDRPRRSRDLVAQGHPADELAGGVDP